MFNTVILCVLADMTQSSQKTEDLEETKPTPTAGEPIGSASAPEGESAGTMEDMQDLDAEMSALSTRLSQALTFGQGTSQLFSLLQALFQFLREITQSLIALLTMARIGELANIFGATGCVSSH